jgi:hypothetical protein
LKGYKLIVNDVSAEMKAPKMSGFVLAGDSKEKKVEVLL